MRSNTTILFLVATALLLAKSDGGPAQKVEVHSSNSSIEVVGGDGENVTVNESSSATVKNMGGRVIIDAEGPEAGRQLIVEVPRRSWIDVVTSNGSITVSGVVGVVRLTTSNGAILMQDAGAAEIHAHTSNGRIEIGMPRGRNANLSARTSNGEIRSDFEIAADQVGETYLSGKIGKGGPPIDLHTSNGAIYLEIATAQETVSSAFKPAEVK